LKILVTGAAGFIGSHLTESLARVGHQIIALDALLPDLYPIEQKVRNWELLGELGSNVERRKIDLRLPLDASEIEECDFIFHLAAMPGLSLSWEDTKLYIDCNVLALANLIKATNPEKLKRFFHISTSSVYGKYVTGNEESKLAPISPYGVTKLAAENLLSAFSKANGLSYSIFRLFSVYGPRQRSDMAFNIFTRKLLAGESIHLFGDGTQSRANTYVSDVVEGLISGMTLSEHGEIYNLCGNEQATIMEVLQMLAEITGREPDIKFMGERLGDQQATNSVAQKAFKSLGFVPKVTLREGLINQVQWQIENQVNPLS
jgi:nucleoside-diphosphate-sugar epimerase